VQDGGDGPVPLSLRAEYKNRSETSPRKRLGESGGERERGETHRGGVEEGEASRAPRRAEAWVDGGIAVEVRAAAELLLVHLPRAHADCRRGLCRRRRSCSGVVVGLRVGLRALESPAPVGSRGLATVEKKKYVTVRGHHTPAQKIVLSADTRT